MADQMGVEKKGPRWAGSYDRRIDPDIALPDCSYPDILQKAFTEHAARPAAHFFGTTLTFHDLDRLSKAFAGFLVEAGCKKGDTVGICLPNVPQYLVVHTGASRLGCITTGVSPLLTPNELRHQLVDSGTRVLIIMDAFFEKQFIDIGKTVPTLKTVVVTNVGDMLPLVMRTVGRWMKKIPTGKVFDVPGIAVTTFKKAIASKTPLPPVSIDPDETCLIQYTGGTTGLPKGAELTHRNIVSNIAVSVAWLGLEQGKETVLSAFPCFHLAGLILSMGAMSSGTSQIMIPDPRDTRLICREIKLLKPTAMANVPSLYHMLLDNPAFAELDLSRCRMFISGAAPFMSEEIERFEAVVGKNKVVEVYGMTEASPLVCMNPVEGTKKTGSVGLPIPHTDVKIMDVETGTMELSTGQEGEITVAGPQVMKGYRNLPGETAKAIRVVNGERTLFTGDIGRMDDDGYMFIVDRVKDMLIVGGYKVFSREVEEEVIRCQGVSACAIVGTKNPDRPGSELVVLFVQPTPGLSDAEKEVVKNNVLAFCHANLAPYKIPKKINLVDALPLTPIGKVDKKVLRLMA